MKIFISHEIHVLVGACAVVLSVLSDGMGPEVGPMTYKKTVVMKGTSCCIYGTGFLQVGSNAE